MWADLSAGRRQFHLKRSKRKWLVCLYQRSGILERDPFASSRMHQLDSGGRLRMKAERDCVPVIFVLFTTMLFTLTACNASPEKSAQVVEPNSISESEQVNATPEQANATPGQGQTDVVRFTDPVLETIVRASIGKQSGAITMDDVKTVTRLDLSNAYQRYISDETGIHDINGLECFTSLETLDLSSHQISDITPLKGLHGLRHLILDDNPMTDISPLAGLSELRLLALSGCKAVDYSAVSSLANLQYLRLDHSTFADVAPLTSLTNLTHLYLSGCSVNNHQPLSDVYPNLVQSDFTIAYTLSELGFGRNRYENQVNFDGEEASVRINHTEWGPVPGSRWMENCVRTVFAKNGFKVDTGYYPRQDVWA